MDVTYLGHSSFRLKGKKVTVVTDPYDAQSVGLKFPSVKADIVTVSHQHQDHNNYQAVKEIQKVISGPGEYEVAGVSIMGFSVFHDDKKGKERGKNIIYVIEIDDVTVCHLGDLGHIIDEKMINEIGDVDILLVPVGGVYTIGPSEAATVVQQIEPSITIPMHYQTAGLNQKTFAKLSGVDEFLGETGLAVEKMEKLSINKTELREDNKIVVLKILN